MQAVNFTGTIRMGGSNAQSLQMGFDPASLASFVSFCKEGTLKQGNFLMKRMFSRMASQVRRRVIAVGYSGRGPHSLGVGPGIYGHTRNMIVKSSGAKKLGGYARVEVGFVGGCRFYKARMNEDGSYKMWTASKMKYGPSLADTRSAVPGGRYTKKSHPVYGKYRGVLPDRAPFAYARKAINENEIREMTTKAVMDALRAAAKRS
jgi:hypothetical protein